MSDVDISAGMTRIHHQRCRLVDVVRWIVGSLLLVGCTADGARPARRPVPEPLEEAPLRVVVISDLNGSHGQIRYGDPVHAAVSRVLELDPDLVLSTGDMIAGQRQGLDYEAMWQGFHAAVSEPLAFAAIPFAVAPGNHDASGYRRFERERLAYASAWAERRPEVAWVDATHFPLRYAFTAGPALFVALDATMVGPLDEEQMRWLDAVLAASTQAVRIVFGHVPLHPFTIGRERESIGDLALEAILRRRDVALFVSGHHHAYYPGRRGPLRLVSMACLGDGPRPLIGTERRSDRAILAFEVTADGVQELDAFAGEAFDEVVPRASLPLFVGEGDGRIARDDAPGQRAK